METVNNLATAASRAIWGEQSTAAHDATKNETGGKEPLSGETGDVKSGEPYDKGNTGDPTPSAGLSDTNTGSNKISATSDNPTSSGTSQNVRSLLDPESSSKSDNVSSASHATNPAHDGTILGAPTNTSGTTAENASMQTPGDASGHAVGSNVLGVPGGNSTSITGDPSSAQQHTQEHQGAGRPMESPAGIAGVGGSQGTGTATGTGEKYEKSTGLAGDGGNFSASMPGAGTEAKRLKDEQGVRHDYHGTVGGDTSKDDEDETGGKLSLKDKIKAKLHKHKD